MHTLYLCGPLYNMFSHKLLSCNLHVNLLCCIICDWIWENQPLCHAWNKWNWALCYVTITVRMFLLKNFKGFLVISVHTYSVLTIRLTSTAQYIILAINIWGVKCDKVVDFPKSGHIYQHNSAAKLWHDSMISAIT